MLHSLITAFASSKPIVSKPPRDERGYKHRAGAKAVHIRVSPSLVPLTFLQGCLVVSSDGERVLLVTRYVLFIFSNGLNSV